MIEGHGIDVVPLAERYGTPRRLFTIWFSANMTILGVALGTLGVASGLGLGWTIVAILVGNGIGTAIMAAHSAQGPKLGVPQMIQSRAQFGVLGAAVPLVAVVATYLLYCVANGVLIEGLIRQIVPVGNAGALGLLAGATLAIACIGYELIHRLGIVLTIVSALLFLAAAWLLLAGSPGHVIVHRYPAAHVSKAAVTTMATQAAAWSLSYGPYVADYSRYLPPRVSPARTFWYTAAGCFIGSCLVMAFGAFFASLQPGAIADPATAFASLFGPARPLADLLIIIGVVQGNVMNLYSAYLSSIAIFSSRRGMIRVVSVVKFAVMAILILTATLIALAVQDDFQAYLGDALSCMLYLLVPWSAINLADYYIVRQGAYHVADLFDRNGIYGAYRWNALLIYCTGIGIQTPFIELTFFRGSVARWIGADIAWLPGLIVPGLLYTLAARHTSFRRRSHA